MNIKSSITLLFKVILISSMTLLSVIGIYYIVDDFTDDKYACCVVGQLDGVVQYCCIDIVEAKDESSANRQYVINHYNDIMLSPATDNTVLISIKLPRDKTHDEIYIKSELHQKYRETIWLDSSYDVFGVESLYNN